MKYFQSQPLSSVSSNKRGFTLVELLIALALFVLILSLNLHVASYLKRMVARIELERIEIACKFLQNRARIEGENQMLRFDISQNSYTYNTTTHYLPKYIKFAIVSDLLGPPSAPSHSISSPITFKNQCIVFHSDGVIQPGTIYMLNTSSQAQYALSCSVAQISYLRKYQFNGRWQLL